jgi:hypothetical protein
MKKVSESSRKTSTVRRGTKFSTIVIEGHLFDTKFFNICINILEEHGIEFRVIEWDVGHTINKNSAVTLQVFAQESTIMDTALDLIEEIAHKNNVHIYEGKGPDVEALVQDIGQKERGV